MNRSTSTSFELSIPDHFIDLLAESVADQVAHRVLSMLNERLEEARQSWQEREEGNRHITAATFLRIGDACNRASLAVAVDWRRIPCDKRQNTVSFRVHFRSTGVGLRACCGPVAEWLGTQP